MYLHKIVLNIKDRKARRAAAGRYHMHRLLSQAMPKQGSPSEPVLWRLENISSRHQPPVLLVQSSAGMDWEKLSDEFSSFQSKKLNFDHIAQAGAAFRFRLEANPTKSTYTAGENGKLAGRGKVVAITSKDEQIHWLEKKSKQGGFTLKEAYIDFSQPERIEKKRNIVLHVARFEGVLQINDKQKFVETLKKGVGRGKAFGCGLLSIAKVYE